MNRIFKIIKKVASKKTRSNTGLISEEQYYEELFIKNNKWNKPTPNDEEFKRWKVIESFIWEIKNNYNLNILDLGCGRGWLTNLISQYGLVTGIEPVGVVLEYAKKLFPKIHFLQGTSANLINQYKQSFDLIVTSEVIEHIPDAEKQQFVKDIYVLLKKNGCIILTTPRKEAHLEWNNYAGADQPIEDWISENDLKLLFEENGFSAKKTERISEQPRADAPFIAIYQVWLFTKI